MGRVRKSIAMIAAGVAIVGGALLGVAAPATATASGVTVAQAASGPCKPILNGKADYCLMIATNGGKIQGYAKSAAIASNVTVGVTNIRISKFVDGRWVKVDETFEYDGLSKFDNGFTSWVGVCANGQDKRVRVQAVVHVKVGSNPTKTFDVSHATTKKC